MTFSGFNVVNAGGDPAPVVNLVSAFNDTSTGILTLNFNPNMNNTAGSTPEDLWFYFQVVGGVNAIDLTVAGTNAAVTEIGCSTAIDVVNGNICRRQSL